MRQLIQRANDKGMTVEYRPYSNSFIAAYRIIIPNTPNGRNVVIIINSTADEERQYEALLQLIDYSEQHKQYGFIAICGDNLLYLNDRFMFDEDEERYIYHRAHKNVVHIAELRGRRFNRDFKKLTGGTTP